MNFRSWLLAPHASRILFAFLALAVAGAGLSGVVFDAGRAMAQQAGTGSLVVLKDCLIVGPDGKIQVPPPPEGNFTLELSKGVSTPQQYQPEAIIESFDLVCGESRTFTGLEPGTYNVLEEGPAQADFGQISNFCINVEVAANQTAECSLTNEKLSTVRPPATGDAGIAGSGSSNGAVLAIAVAAGAIGFGLLGRRLRAS